MNKHWTEEEKNLLVELTTSRESVKQGLLDFVASSNYRTYAGAYKKYSDMQKSGEYSDILNGIASNMENDNCSFIGKIKSFLYNLFN